MVGKLFCDNKRSKNPKMICWIVNANLLTHKYHLNNTSYVDMFSMRFGRLRMLLNVYKYLTLFFFLKISIFFIYVGRLVCGLHQSDQCLKQKELKCVFRN